MEIFPSFPHRTEAILRDYKDAFPLPPLPEFSLAILASGSSPLFVAVPGN